MPEGDTIFLLAQRLHAALAGRRVTGVETPVVQLRRMLPERLVGQVVEGVEARGKHLLHWFSPSGFALHTHLRMNGSWQLYGPGEPWRRLPSTGSPRDVSFRERGAGTRHHAKFVLRTDEVVAVAFNMPVLELLSSAQVASHPGIATLGPDPLSGDPTAPPDLAEARRRMDARAEIPVGEVLQDQRVLAGVGNVYRNEIMFIHAVDPWTLVADVPPEVRDALLSTASALLQANVTPAARGPRVTTRSPRAIATGQARRAGRERYVYGRAGRDCPRCGAAIRIASQGRLARPTYWCPRCQGPGPP